jgi:hypothetical protein
LDSFPFIFLLTAYLHSYNEEQSLIWSQFAIDGAFFLHFETLIIQSTFKTFNTNCMPSVSVQNTFFSEFSTIINSNMINVQTSEVWVTLSPLTFKFLILYIVTDCTNMRDLSSRNIVMEQETKSGVRQKLLHHQPFNSGIKSLRATLPDEIFYWGVCFLNCAFR